METDKKLTSVLKPNDNNNSNTKKKTNEEKKKTTIRKTQLTNLYIEFNVYT